jgi:mono/diheme cytochrome c family protein
LRYRHKKTSSVEPVARGLFVARGFSPALPFVSVARGFSPASLIFAFAFIFGAAAFDAQTSRTTWDGVYTDAQAARGATLYVANCAQCHGPTLSGAEGPPLTGVEFTSNWNGLSLGDLFERVRTSMPPDDPSRLSAREKVDVLAHILATSRFPAGASELSRDALPQITFRASRP